MGTRDYSDETATVIDEEVELIVRGCETRCFETLTEYRNALDLVARALLEHETISGAEVRRLVAVSRGEAVPAPPAAEPDPVPTSDLGPSSPNGSPKGATYVPGSDTSSSPTDSE